MKILKFLFAISVIAVAALAQGPAGPNVSLRSGPGAATSLVCNDASAGAIYTQTTAGGVTYVCQQTSAGMYGWTSAPAVSGGSLVIAAGKTFTANNTITLGGTDSTTITFPTTSATMARTDAGQTFTGVDVFTNPVIIGPAPVACGATCSPTAGQLILCATAAGCAMSLPTAAASGNVIRMRITVTTTSGAEKVLLATTTNTIIGTAIGWTGSTPAAFAGNAGTYHSLQMPYSGSQPSGGFIGDLITCTDIASTVWACDVQFEAGTSPTTPYSTSTT